MENMSSRPLTSPEGAGRGGTDSAPVSPDHWVDEHGDALYRYALLRTRDQHKAEELVQETFLAALEARNRFAGAASVRTWLIGILKHKITDQFRNEARELQSEDPADSHDEENWIDENFTSRGRWSANLTDWGDPVKTLQEGQFLDVLQYCLKHMPERLAHLFVMREVSEEDTESICRELEITSANLWTMLYRARMRLRQCLDRNWLK